MDAPDAAALPTRPRRAGVRVLLAEDNEVNQEIARELLLAAGCEVDIAADGEEAVERARQARYDLVLMDLNMPRMDGLAATRAIRALPGWADTPILAMTADLFDHSLQAGRAAGMNGSIVKPFGPDDLDAALLRWLPTGAAATPPP